MVEVVLVTIVVVVTDDTELITSVTVFVALMVTVVLGPLVVVVVKQAVRVSGTLSALDANISVAVGVLVCS